MKYRALDDNGDMVAGHGSVDFLTDADAVGQAVKTRLLLFLGEWWENTSDGLPFFEEIAGKRDLKRAELRIRERIAGTTGVLEILSLECGLNERREFSVYCELQTVFGVTEVRI